ncbi:hypothetical protein EGH10_10070 [Brevibacillus laterosporus]|uniref:DUF2157 domain-containing protein n=1 Tax=Brevibacillus laterosporus LMG 15441 TaxID=1042163 RepID=A0A075R3P8_BRELA|nr:membrane protein [Brevibacillus laterosporus]AIG25768.1 hypothetical protein BRLA_c014290 [Brevibacillus laterosporus LMG 15441]RJL08836.1 hypothetical protein DM460_16005 [Brevibacillus laterosporus]TPH13107.1 hypothetical protein EGH10_10070 [Brevibacillus laterosporus]
MDDQRRKIIITEIENWRRNHLLPEHYCIFLLNLYTEGKHAPNQEEPITKKRFFLFPNRKARMDKLYNQQAFLQSARTPIQGSGKEAQILSVKLMGGIFFIGLVIAVMLLLAFYFNAFSIPMQMSILVFSWILAYVLAFVFKRKIPLLSYFFLLVTILIAITSLYYFGEKWKISQVTYLWWLLLIAGYSFLHGLLFRYSLLILAGLIGIGILYGTAMLTRMGEFFSWTNIELYWVPLSFLMIGLGYLFHVRHQQLAYTLVVSGLLYFFGPEISSLWVPEASREIMQIILGSKVLLSGLLLTITRHYWLEWLRR